ncbi:MAG: hypothetical protein ACTSWN_12270 [Promethearchaeota archaeon]
MIDVFEPAGRSMTFKTIPELYFSEKLVPVLMMFVLFAPILA